MKMKITMGVIRKCNEQYLTEWEFDFNYLTSVNDIKKDPHFKWIVQNATLFDKIIVRCEIEATEYIQFIKKAFFSYTLNMDYINFVHNLARVIIGTGLEIYSEYESTKHHIKKGVFSK